MPQQGGEVVFTAGGSRSPLDHAENSGGRVSGQWTGKPPAVRSVLQQARAWGWGVGGHWVLAAVGAAGPGPWQSCLATPLGQTRVGRGKKGGDRWWVQPTGSVRLLQPPHSGARVTARAGPAAVVTARGTCCARSGSPPPSLASPWRNSCTSTRPSLLLSSSSNRRPQRCRRSASPEPPRMAPARGGGEAPQRWPRRGLSGSPSPPGAPTGSAPATTRTAASALRGRAPALAGSDKC